MEQLILLLHKKQYEILNLIKNEQKSPIEGINYLRGYLDALVSLNLISAHDTGLILENFIKLISIKIKFKS